MMKHHYRADGIFTGSVSVHEAVQRPGPSAYEMAPVNGPKRQAAKKR